MCWNKNKVIIIIIIKIIIIINIIIVIITIIRLFYLSQNELIWSDWVVISVEGYRDVFCTLEVNDQLISELVFSGLQTSGGVEVNKHLQLNTTPTTYTTDSTLNQSIRQSSRVLSATLEASG